MKEIKVMNEKNIYKATLKIIDSKKNLIEAMGGFSEQEQLKFDLDRRIKEIYNSNRIEGSTITLGDTAYIIKDKKFIEEKSQRENLEVVNLNSLIIYTNKLLSNKTDISKELLLKFHQSLMSGIDDIDKIGEYRNVRNWIGGASIETSTPEAVPVHMEQLLKWYEEQKNRLHPIELAIRFKYRFVCIHPFEDGNGRISRVLMNYILRLNGYQSIYIPCEKRREYYNALEESHSQGEKYDCPALIKFILDTVVKQYDEYLSYFE